MGAETITFWGHPQCLFGDSFVVFLRHCGGTFSPSPPVICTTCQSVAPEAKKKKKCLLRYVGGVVPFSKPCDVKTGFVTASFHPTLLPFSKGEGGCTVSALLLLCSCSSSSSSFCCGISEGAFFSFPFVSSFFRWRRQHHFVAA